LVQPIYVLRQQREAAILRREIFPQHRQSQMRRVWFCRRTFLAPPIVPATHRLRIAGKRFRRRKLARIKLCPQSFHRIAERRNAAFG